MLTVSLFKQILVGNEESVLDRKRIKREKPRRDRERARERESRGKNTAMRDKEEGSKQVTKSS